MQREAHSVHSVKSRAASPDDHFQTNITISLGNMLLSVDLIIRAEWKIKQFVLRETNEEILQIKEFDSSPLKSANYI